MRGGVGASVLRGGAKALYRGAPVQFVYLHECKHSTMVAALIRYPWHKWQIMCGLTAVSRTGRGLVIIIDVADVAVAVVVAVSSVCCSSSAEAPPLLLASSLVVDVVVDHEEEHDEAEEA